MKELRLTNKALISYLKMADHTCNKHVLKKYHTQSRTSMQIMCERAFLYCLNITKYDFDI